jgi:hypothetical protein
VNLETLLPVLGQGAMASPMAALKGPIIAAGKCFRPCLYSEGKYGQSHDRVLPAGALSEGMALAERAELNLETLLTVLGQGALASPMIALKGPNMAAGKFDPAFPLKHQQKDMRLALELGCALMECSACITMKLL